MKKFIRPNTIFSNFKNGQKINFWTEKKFKTAKNAISRKKIIYLISRVFLPGLFLNFLAHCVLITYDVAWSDLPYFYFLLFFFWNLFVLEEFHGKSYVETNFHKFLILRYLHLDYLCNFPVVWARNLQLNLNPVDVLLSGILNK